MHRLIKICILVVSFNSFASSANSQEVVVNSSLTTGSIPQAKLRSIFSMRVKRWEDESAITVFVLSGDSKLHREFCLSTLEVFPYQLQRIWDVMLFSGTGTIPVEVKDEKTMLEKIANTPGSIGYVRSYKGDIPNVKALRLQKAP